MRSVSLANRQVISLLNRCFVSVITSNEDFTGKGSATAEDRAQLRRIFAEGYAAKLSVGTVHAYILRPDGHLMDSLHVVEAAKGAPLVDALQRAVKQLNVAGGEPVIQPGPPPMPAPEPGTLRLHIVARYLEQRAGELVITGQGENRGNWSDSPGEDWVTLDRSQWVQFLPRGAAKAGDSWPIDPSVAALLWKHFYPPTEDNDLINNRIESQALRAELVSVQGDRGQVRLSGSLRMKHPFYHKDDDNFVNATAIGFLEFEGHPRRISTLTLATEQASYGAKTASPFGVAVQSISAPR